MQILLLDGAMGTELTRRGWDVSDALWSARVLLEHPEAIEQIHYDYLRAGADCITTASYQVSFAGFEKAGKSREATALALTESVRIAKRARTRFANEFGQRREPLVAASVGPYGASLADGSEYHGNYACERMELLTFHMQRMFCLSAAEPDLFACETIPSWDEAEVLVEALHQFPHLPAWFSFACRDGEYTVHGERMRDCARALATERQVLAIGINCTAPLHVNALIAEIRAETSKPIVVYPNSGKTWDARARCWVGESSARSWEASAVEWFKQGASWIGGCCGTTPEDIGRMRLALEKEFPQGFTILKESEER
jgi:homocysteine S-methyltransferase